MWEARAVEEAPEVVTDRVDDPPTAEASNDTFRRSVAWIALWVPFAVLAARSWNYSPDDTLITMRIARNLLQGNGPVFNPGDPVEGFTSPLHLLLSAVLQALPGGLELLKHKLASVAFGFLSLWQARKLIDATVADGWWQVLGYAMVSGSWILALNAVNGLETSMAVFLIVVLLRWSIDSTMAEHPWRAGLVAWAVVLARPEAALVVLSILAVSAGRARSERSWAVLRWAGVALGLGLATIAVRAWYFHALVPNTARAKDVPWSRSVPDGLQYLRNDLGPSSSLHPTSPGVLAGTAAFVLLLGLLALGTWLIASGHRDLLALPLAVIGQGVFVLMAGGDWLNVGRFIAPVVPAMVVVQLFGVQRIRGRLVPAICAVGLVATIPFGAISRPAPFGLLNTAGLSDQGLMNQSNELWAKTPELFRCAPPGSTVAHTEMGFGPWVRGDLRFIDMRGLVDRTMVDASKPADRSSSGVRDPRWQPPDDLALAVLDQEPAMIVVPGDPITVGPLADRYRPVAAITDGWSTFTAYLDRQVPCAGEGSN